MAAQNHLLGNAAFLLQDINGILDCLLSPSGAGNRGCDLSLHHHVHALVLSSKAVAPHNLDGLLHPHIPQRLIGSLRHIIAVGKNHIHALQFPLHRNNRIIRRIFQLFVHVMGFQRNLGIFLHDGVKALDPLLVLYGSHISAQFQHPPRTPV